MNSGTPVTVAATVVFVSPPLPSGKTRLLLDCGHWQKVDNDDEASLSFKGAETGCDKHTLWEDAP